MMMMMIDTMMMIILRYSYNLLDSLLKDNLPNFCSYIFFY